MGATDTAPTPARRGHWWSGSRGERLALAVGAAILEVLPISIWLQAGAAFSTGSPSQALAPFWLLLLTILSAQWLARAMRQQPASSAVVAAVPLLVVLCAIGLIVSPLIYGNVPGEPFSFLGALASDLFHGSGRLNAVFWMTVLLGYVWWRGLRAGRGEPTLDGLLTLFKFSFAAVVAGVIFAVLAQGFGRVELTGRLAVLLPLEVFVALVTLALARAVAQPVTGAVAAEHASDDRPWLSLSLLLAGGVVGAALLLSLILSFDTLQAALYSLGPVGAALYAGISWLIYGLSFVLFWIFSGPINYIRSLGGQSKLHVPTPPPPPKNACSTPNCLPTSLPPAQGIVVAIFLALVLIALIALVAYFVYRTLRALRGQSRPDEVWEEREALDGDPLRDLLAGLRRRGPRRVAEDTPGDGVRRVYRDVLDAAAATGVGRRPNETPDEYERRLAESLPAAPARQGTTVAEVETLTAAYDRARYGEDEPPPTEQRRLRGQGEAIIRRLRARQPARRERGG